jgi:DNA-binding NarL/FixJ family response regulator
MTADQRWTIRGIPPEVQRAVAARASATRQTVGEIVLAALNAVLATEPTGDRPAEPHDRLAALEARVSAVEAALADIRQMKGERSANEPRRSRRQAVVPQAEDGVLVVGAGTRKRLTEQGQQEVRRRMTAGMSDRSIAKTLGVSGQAIHRLRKQARHEDG